MLFKLQYNLFNTLNISRCFKTLAGH